MKPSCGLVLVAAMTASTSRANAADESPAACVEAHRAAQRERYGHRLLSAKAQLLACSSEECPALIRRDCTDWLTAVEAETPTIVLDPRGEDGLVVVGASASVDGAPFAASLDGRALPVDPGERVVRIDAPGRPTTERRIIILAGERAQRIVVTLEDPLSPPSRRATSTAEDPPGRPLAVPIALGAVGVVGLALFTGFGAAGSAIQSDLDDARCRPRCDVDRVDRMWTNFTVADVSLAIGVAALAAGAIYYALAR